MGHAVTALSSKIALPWNGVCIDLQGEFSAFDARQLSQHWSRIPASVDGQFILVRGQQHPAQLEVVTDSLGAAQLYYAKVSAGWVLSNSVRALRRSVMSYRENVVRPEAEALVTEYLDQFVDHMRDDGFFSTELETLFYLEERVRRWSGNNFRQVTSYRDVFSPYCTRAYTMAAFKVPLLCRYANHVQYELLGYLNRDMQQFPFERAWFPQQPQALRIRLLRQYYRQSKSKIVQLVRHLLHRTNPSQERHARYNQRATWLDQYLPQLRQRVFDQSSSPLWDYVDRPRLEHLLDPNTPTMERYRSQATLFDTLTLYHYRLACESHTPPRAGKQAVQHNHCDAGNHGVTAHNIPSLSETG